MVQSPILKLKEMFPWPPEMPTVEKDGHGWFREQNVKVLQKQFDSPIKPRVVIELGSWLGLSTRFLAERAETVIAIDHWEGGPEHHASKWEAIKGRLPTLYETFLTNCWHIKDKIIPLRMTTEEGLRVCAKEGVVPDLIYIDAGHDFENVTNDIKVSKELFPDAMLVGDDWERNGVHKAVMNYVYDKDITLNVYGCVWWFK
jgi:hypothetical protein